MKDWKPLVNHEKFNYWLAGFYEGEGSAGFYRFKHKRKNRTYKEYLLSMTICQSKREILQTIRSYVGFGYIRKSIGGFSGKPCYSLQFTNAQARKFGSFIFPYLQSTHKSKQLFNALTKDNENVKPRE